MVLNGHRMSPTGLAGEHVDGLPPDTAAAYDEARVTASGGAFTACELMCRKILMHVAVDKGADTNKSFAYYIDFLQNAGFITPPMKPWVDIIRLRGNEATHEIPASTLEKATGSLAFTTQLLRLVYEMEFRAAQFMPPPTA
ncbi:DUF4145 domain-containing protein [Amycolatopsis sp. NPDC051373]|uniref:DUF4145 domain-containing protein n=1 Tax=Amycolatopsis sp. NPDC051373 TaxID=3155801 RepID=UPI00344E7F26